MSDKTPASIHLINRSANGLRGIAALVVACAHFSAAFIPGMMNRIYPETFSQVLPGGLFDLVILSPICSIYYNGWLAVAVFFVLSGYVLTLPHFNGGPPGILKQRMAGRFLRLNIPIFGAIFISYAFYAAHLYFNHQASKISGSITWLDQPFSEGLTFGQALKAAFYRAVLAGDNRFDNPLWTVSIEFFGSIQLLLFYIWKPKAWSATLTFLAVSLVLYLNKETGIFVAAMFLGAVLNVWKFRGRWLLFIFVLGYYFGGYQHGSVFYDFLPTPEIYGGELAARSRLYNTLGEILLTAAIVNGFAARLFQSAFAQFLGRISYPLYLLHFIILFSLACALYIRLPTGPASLLMVFVAYLGTTFVASYYFARYVDSAAIRISHTISNYLYSADDNT